MLPWKNKWHDFIDAPIKNVSAGAQSKINLSNSQVGKGPNSQDLLMKY